MTLRVGPALQLSRTQEYLSDLGQRLADATEKAITGLAVNDPSDAPARWPEIYRVQDGIDDQIQFQDNSSRASSMLDLADTALEEAHDLVTRAMELAVTFSSEIYTAQDRQAAAQEVDALLESLIALGNTEQAGRYVFAGTDYDTPPFTTGTGAYTGSTEQPTARIGTNNWVTTGYDGSSIFDNAITTLTDLSTELSTGTAASVRAQLAPLDLADADLIRGRYTVGSDLQFTIDAVGLAEKLEALLVTRQDSLVGADPIEAYSELAELQTSYQAALQVTAKSADQNLFSVLL